MNFRSPRFIFGSVIFLEFNRGRAVGLFASLEAAALHLSLIEDSNKRR